MTFYKTGRSTDYRGSETPPKKYAARKLNVTGDAIEQFNRMAQGLAPRVVKGDEIAWVADDTLTDDQREWCRETAAMVKREAEIAATLKPRKTYPARRTASQMEREIAAVLQFKPDATAHDIRIATGIEHSWILRSETWAMTHMGKQEVKHE